MKTHKDLHVWNDGLDLVEEVYKTTAKFPNEERFGLTSQMRRAAISIPCNIAEGAARDSTREFIRFLRISLGSITELETQIILAERLGYINGDNKFTELGSIKAMLINLVKALKQTESEGI